MTTLRLTIRKALHIACVEATDNGVFRHASYGKRRHSELHGRRGATQQPQTEANDRFFVCRFSIRHHKESPAQAACLEYRPEPLVGARRAREGGERQVLDRPRVCHFGRSPCRRLRRRKPLALRRGRVLHCRRRRSGCGCRHLSGTGWGARTTEDAARDQANRNEPRDGRLWRRSRELFTPGTPRSRAFTRRRVRRPACRARRASPARAARPRPQRRTPPPRPSATKPLR